MTTSGDVNVQNKPKQPRCIWTDADDLAMVTVLKLQKDAGNQSGAGWKSTVWTAVETKLQKSLSKGAPKTATKCSDHWQKVRHFRLNFIVVLFIFIT